MNKTILWSVGLTLAAIVILALVWSHGATTGVQTVTPSATSTAKNVANTIAGAVQSATNAI